MSHNTNKFHHLQWCSPLSFLQTAAEAGTLQSVIQRVHLADYVAYNGPEISASSCCDGDLGMLALWALLALSAYVPAQVSICKCVRRRLPRLFLLPCALGFATTGTVRCPLPWLANARVTRLLRPNASAKVIA